MANTAGGGAIVVGVANDGTRIGTHLEPEWLRDRIWELTEGKLTRRCAGRGTRRLPPTRAFHPRGHRTYPLPGTVPLAGGRQLRGDRSHDLARSAAAQPGIRLVG